MFIGREKELKTLDRLYQSDQFEFVVIYGRRRVGKRTDYRGDRCRTRGLI